MELKDIISSGLLELYVLGLSSPEERTQVESWIMSYPEVKKEVEVISMAMEDYAMANIVQPSAEVKKKIFTGLNITLAAATDGVNKHEQLTGKVYSIPSYFKWAIAASVILLAGSLILNYTFYNRYRSAASGIEAMQQQLTQQKQTSDAALKQLQQQKQNADVALDQLQKQRQTTNLTQEQLTQQKQAATAMEQELERQRVIAEAMNKDIDVMTNKNSLPVVLNGTPHAPDALAKIFWMKNTGEVYVDPTYLPQAPAGKQYQLWAIVDGKPIDAGMISTSKGVYHIQKMKSFGKAEAFAITLEKAGGSPTPNMKEMYVMSKI